MAEDGCYIVALSSMEHPQCPVDPAFVRGERLFFFMLFFSRLARLALEVGRRYLLYLTALFAIHVSAVYVSFG